MPKLYPAPLSESDVADVSRVRRNALRAARAAPSTSSRGTCACDDHCGLAAAARSGAIVPALILDPATQGTARPLAAPGRVLSGGRRGARRSAPRARDARSSSGAGRSSRRRSASRARRASATVAWSAAYDSATREEHRRLQAALEESGYRALAVHDAPAVSPEETAAARADGAGSGYRSLAPYVAAWLAAARIEGPPEPRFAEHELESEPLPTPREFEERGEPGELPPARPGGVGGVRAVSSRARAAVSDGAAGACRAADLPPRSTALVRHDLGARPRSGDRGPRARPVPALRGASRAREAHRAHSLSATSSFSSRGISRTLRTSRCRPRMRALSLRAWASAPGGLDRGADRLPARRCRDARARGDRLDAPSRPARSRPRSSVSISGSIGASAGPPGIAF